MRIPVFARRVTTLVARYFVGVRVNLMGAELYTYRVVARE